MLDRTVILWYYRLFSEYLFSLTDQLIGSFLLFIFRIEELIGVLILLFCRFGAVEMDS